ncbi:MAG: OmpA family protein [Zhongshania sp.]|uniref:OmpA family protein n=1 Tax=Zhongshania sp. TaxID=1971902 RepID=UPI002601B013|nr:OmpA family protein [Zhongshania sp.]MDF1693718.1 OmpA family protein [Zhongshania sp.]
MNNNDWRSLAVLIGFFPLLSGAAEGPVTYYLSTGMALVWPASEAALSDRGRDLSPLFPSADSTANPQLGYDGGNRMGIGVGLGFAEDWRAEVGYFGERLGLDNTDSRGAPQAYSSLRKQSASASVWRDTPLGNSRVNLAIGGGVSGIRAVLAGDTQLLWELHGGVALGVVLTPRWLVDVSYQYFVGEDLHFQAPDYDFSSASRGQRWQLGLRYQLFSAGRSADLDSDGDGISDNNDRCPNTLRAAITDHYGCADSDGDSVIDPIDRCPNTPAGNEVDSNGCMDSDNDGVKNSADQCPNSAQGERVLRNGCAARQAVRLEGIAFGLGETLVSDQAREHLSRVAEVMLASPQFRLAVQGHSDNSGSEELNYRVSRARARAVRAELIALGVAAQRMDVQAFGASMPIADNNSSEGRARNRRVSLKVIRAK